MNESNVKEYFGGKLDEAIKSLKRFLYTAVAFWVILFVAIVVVIAALASASGSASAGDGMYTAIAAAGTLGAIAAIVLLVLFIANLVYNIIGALRFTNLFTLLNSNQSSLNMAHSGAQMLELTNAIKNVRNYLWGILGIFVFSAIISSIVGLGFLFSIVSLVLFVLVWKHKNQLVRFREEGSI